MDFQPLSNFEILQTEAYLKNFGLEATEEKDGSDCWWLKKNALEDNIDPTEFDSIPEDDIFGACVWSKDHERYIEFVKQADGNFSIYQEYGEPVYNDLGKLYTAFEKLEPIIFYIR